MSEREVCTITICLSHDYNRELGFELEDAVKESWNKMIPWFTRRHNITNGTIDLEGGAVRITWQYERFDEERPAEVEVALNNTSITKEK